MTHLIENYGLFFLFGIICLESAGLWLPGETALIAAGVYASKGNLSITAVIAVATAAAIIGDNIGYWLGREVGRPLLHRYATLRRFADRRCRRPNDSSNGTAARRCSSLVSSAASA